MTRGHRYDQVCLEKIAEKEHAYIGMIGSRRRTTLVKKLLEEQGTDKAVLDAVYTPIGLDIGAETPEEIGVAIIAEIIEVKNKKKRTFGYSKEMVRAIMVTEKYPGRKVMRTNYYKKGIGTAGNRCEDAGARRWQLYRNHWRWLYGVSGTAESIASAEK